MTGLCRKFSASLSIVFLSLVSASDDDHRRFLPQPLQTEMQIVLPGSFQTNPRVSTSVWVQVFHAQNLKKSSCAQHRISILSLGGVTVE